MIKPYPPPFSRPLQLGNSGADVFILQLLLTRYLVWQMSDLSHQKPWDSLTCCKVQEELLNKNGVLDQETLKILESFIVEKCFSEPSASTKSTARELITIENQYFTPQVALQLLKLYGNDKYQDEYIQNSNNLTCCYSRLNITLPQPYLFYIHVPVYEDRSIETECQLFDNKGILKFTFRGRTQGKNGLNQLTINGDTPTGLYTCDLNAPFSEIYVKSFGPYPMVRLVQGLKGNAAYIYPKIRSGILIHTGEWNSYNPMPNSHGCIHITPQDAKRISEILINELGVNVHDNLSGKLPYPFNVQGLISVVEQVQKKKSE